MPPTGTAVGVGVRAPGTTATPEGFVPEAKLEHVSFQSFLRAGAGNHR